jgi:hypothetical protein
VMDGEMVLERVRQGHAVPEWQVLPVRASHFIKSMALYGVGVIVLAALLIVLATHPDYAVTPGSSIDSASVLGFWRTIDFIVGAIFVLAAVGATLLAVRDYTARHSQLLVLMPEGFVIQTGANARTRRTVSYAAFSGINVTVNRGEYYLRIPRLDGRGSIRIQLDGRFGPPKEIVQRITNAHASFAAAQMQA